MIDADPGMKTAGKPVDDLLHPLFTSDDDEGACEAQR